MQSEVLAGADLSPSTAELVRSLQSAGFSAEKIKTALQVLGSPKHFIPRKATFFLDWISNILIRTADKHKPRETTEQFARIAFLNVASWAFFNHVSALARSETISAAAAVVLHPRLLNPLASALAFLLLENRPMELPSVELPIPHEASLLLELERTVTLLFSHQIMSVSFRPSLEDVAKFISDLLSALLVDDRTASALDAVPAIFRVLSLALDVFLDVAKQQANPRKVFSVVVSKSLPQLLDLYRHQHQVNPTLKAQIERIIDVSLFHHSFLPEFAIYFAGSKQQQQPQQQASSSSSSAMEPATKRRKLNPSTPSSSNTQQQSFCRQLFDKFDEMITASKSNPSTLDSLVVGMNLVYDRFLNACASASGRSARRIAAAVSATSTAAADADDEDGTNSKASGARLESSLEFAFFLELSALSSKSDHISRALLLAPLLDCAATHDIYKLAAMDERSENIQKQAIESFVSELFQTLSSPAGSEVAFLRCFLSCVRSVVLMNHLILESHLPKIFSLVWTSSALDPAVAEASAEFVVSLFETYGSLRQFDDLLRTIATCLRGMDSSSHEIHWFFAHQSIWNKFCGVVESLPPGQLTLIWQFFAEEIYEHYVVEMLASIAIAGNDAMDVDGAVLANSPEARFPYIVALFSGFIDCVQLLSEGQAQLLHTKLEDTLNTCIAPILLPVLDQLNSSRAEERGSASKSTNREFVLSSLHLYTTLMRFDSFCRFRHLAPSPTVAAGPFEAIHAELSLPSLLDAMKRTGALESNPRAAHVALECISFRIQELFKATRAVSGANFVDLFKVFNATHSISSSTNTAELNELIQFVWTWCSVSANNCIPSSSSKEGTISLSSFMFLTASTPQRDIFAQFWAVLARDFPVYISSADCLDDASVEAFLRGLIRTVISDPFAVASEILANASLWEIPRVHRLLPAAVIREMTIALGVSSNQQTPKKKSSKRKSTGGGASEQLDSAASEILLRCAELATSSSEWSTTDDSAMANYFKMIKTRQSDARQPSLAADQLCGILRLCAALPCWRTDITTTNTMAASSLPLIRACIVVNSILLEEFTSRQADSVLDQIVSSPHVHTGSLMLSNVIAARSALANLFDQLVTNAPADACSCIEPDTLLGDSRFFVSFVSAIMQLALIPVEKSEASSKDRSKLPRKALEKIVSFIKSDIDVATSVSLSVALFQAVSNALLAAETRSSTNKAARRRARKHVIRDDDIESKLPVGYSIPSWCTSALESVSKVALKKLRIDTSSSQLAADLLASGSQKSAIELCCALVESVRGLKSPHCAADKESLTSLQSLVGPLARPLLAIATLALDSPVDEQIREACLRSCALCAPVFEPVLSAEEFGQLLADCYAVSSVSTKGHDALMSHLLENASTDQLHIFLEHASIELASKNQSRVVAVAALVVRSLITFYEKVDQSIRYQVAPSHAGPLILASCSLLTQLVPSRAVLPSPMLVSLTSGVFAVLTRIVSDKFVTLSLRQFGVVMQTLVTAQALLENILASPADGSSSIIFDAAYRLLWALLKHRSAFVFKCIATFLMSVKHLMRLLLKRGSMPSASSVAPAENLARLLTELSQNDTVMRKCTIYMVVEYLQLVEFEAVDPSVRQPLLPGVYALLDICSDPEFNQIHKSLDETGKVMFKSLLADYRRDYKFKGKV